MIPICWTKEEYLLALDCLNLYSLNLKNDRSQNAKNAASLLSALTSLQPEVEKLAALYGGKGLFRLKLEHHDRVIIWRALEWRQKQIQSLEDELYLVEDLARIFRKTLTPYELREEKELMIYEALARQGKNIEEGEESE